MEVLGAKGALARDVAGRTLVMLPEKLLFLPTDGALIVADTHFGKANHFRRAGIPVPTGTTASMLQRLTSAIQRLEASALIVAGDFVHSSQRNREGFEAELIQWRRSLPALELTLVRGNHDRGHSALFTQLEMQIVTELTMGPFRVVHHPPESQTSTEGFAICGHLHPAIQLSDPSGREKLPVFWHRKTMLVLPAFGEFTGTHLIKPVCGEDVYGVVEDAVVELPRELTRT